MEFRCYILDRIETGRGFWVPYFRQGCWGCEDFETCSKLDFLKPTHGDAHLKNLGKIRRYGVERFLNGKRYW
ncbi:MAG: hypothetical protein DRN12_04540 [Thermoplasmata archaeon]|nr:MAG: hypothetical protein DRN12_04540 [Thermoplasmata archaeon]